MTRLLLAEELLLVALDDRKGTDGAAYSSDAALAGALLLDLVEAGHLRESGGRLEPQAGPPPAHPVLADALAAVRAEDRPRDAGHWVGALPKAVGPLKARVADGLVARGILSEERRRVLGLFKATVYPEADAGPERALRERLAAALLGEEAPDRRTALLIALLRPVRLIPRLVPKDRRAEAERRAEALAEAGEVGGAVEVAVEEVEAAVRVAVFASTTASTSVATGSG
jgi:hypothetical protein